MYDCYSMPFEYLTVVCMIVTICLFEYLSVVCMIVTVCLLSTECGLTIVTLPRLWKNRKVSGTWSPSGHFRAEKNLLLIPGMIR